ncbi:hypothetical protein BD310DRAFT_611498 [Dichomitus squalens]|uniref:Uncharacterized protein n=1 Tax=Dichomitus squalens TaxID=114155 RepID=A0A4Q9PQE2_9APHY|nr:hypothetical protein BD310DRAFT_611498 [Dichomitus squalens]
MSLCIAVAAWRANWKRLLFFVACYSAISAAVILSPRPLGAVLRITLLYVWLTRCFKPQGLRPLTSGGTNIPIIIRGNGGGSRHAQEESSDEYLGALQPRVTESMYVLMTSLPL